MKKVQDENVLLKEIEEHKKKITELQNQLCKSQKENLKEEFKEFIGKWLYCEGYESGSTLLYAQEIRRNHKGELGFKGVRVGLGTENSNVTGVQVDSTYSNELFDFEESIPYWKDYSDDDNVDENDDIAMLKMNLSNQEIMSTNEVEKILNCHLYWCFETLDELPESAIPFKKYANL
jgi:hypothetical protein